MTEKPEIDTVYYPDDVPHNIRSFINCLKADDPSIVFEPFQEDVADRFMMTTTYFNKNLRAISKASTSGEQKALLREVRDVFNDTVEFMEQSPHFTAMVLLLNGFVTHEAVYPKSIRKMVRRTHHEDLSTPASLKRFGKLIGGQINGPAHPRTMRFIKDKLEVAYSRWLLDYIIGPRN